MNAFASCPPGLEPWVADELRALGFAPTLDEGGCVFACDAEGLYRANLELRIATRVVVRVAEFHAGHFIELEKQGMAMDWAAWLPQAVTTRVEATCYRSKLYHEKAVAERVQRALSARIGAVAAAKDVPAQLVLVRVVANVCTISIDSSGELLHRRGYRQELTKATLRETLAAALVAFSGWNRALPLVDPLCGSGTIAIEAALLARALAPGRRREFACMKWPGFDKAAWRRLLLDIDGRERGEKPAIYASDRDAGAIEIAKANAARAGVLEDIHFACAPLKAAPLPSGPFHLVTNPPYGERLSGPGDLRNLYATLGNMVRARGPDARLTFISSNPRWTGNTGLRCELGPRLANGTIPIRFARSLPAAIVDDRRVQTEAAHHGLAADDWLLVVDVARQELRAWQRGRMQVRYDVSTARRGVGNREGSFMTPPGWHEIDERIGGDQPVGSVFKERVHSGRVIPEKEWGAAKEPGDLILSRILWLRGLQDGVNRGPGIDTHDRYIYLHGTIHEERIGNPASAGCIRMRNRDIVDLFEKLGAARTLVWIG